MFQLKANWDQKGARPGLILVANLDVDGRRLPDTVRSEKPQVLDSEQPLLPKADDEAKLLFVVQEGKTPPPPDARPWLVMQEPAEDTVRLLTPGGKRFFGLHSDDVGRYPVSAGGNPTARLDAVRLPGSPLGSVRKTTVGLELRDKTGVLESQQGDVAVAPLILAGDLGVPQRLYMCLDPDENDPSTIEVRAACGLAGVPFAGIPVDVHGGDTWIQDQFQLGYCVAPDRTMQVLLHLPRVRAGFVLGQAGGNLSTMVDGHFPSTNLGVCRDFWQREFGLTDVSGKTRKLKFAESGQLLYVISSVSTVFDMLWFQLILLEEPFDPSPYTTFAKLRAGIPLALKAMRAATARVKPKVDPVRSSQLDQRLKALEQIVDAVEKALPLTSAGIGLPIGGAMAVFSANEVDTFTKRLLAAHDSLNYGGNVEVGPPSSAAPAGKIVIGEQPPPLDPDEQQREIDPDLFKFLAAQGVQPVVTIDTGWLDVGHVDELISFVPDKQSASRAAILRAAPEVALKIIRELGTRFLNGLGAKDPLYDPVYLGTRDRRTMVGSFPVTMMFRGKFWLHRHAPGDSAPLEPPRIYHKMAMADLKQRPSAHHIEYTAGIGDNRHYRAAISILEFLEFEEGTNDTIATDKMAPLDEILTKEFPDSRIIGVPVLFDVVEDLAYQRTSAYSPDLVNVQVLGNVVVMARPYGPRVPVDAAADVLRTVLPDSLRARATKSVLTGKKLDVTVHWAKSLPGYPVSATTLAEDFRDGSPKSKVGDIAKAIMKANPAHFLPSGELQSGWRRLIIPEATVDVFQAYTELVTEPLGMVIQWVDSWYYHTGLGGIHCATNVLRRPEPPLMPWWKTQG